VFAIGYTSELRLLIKLFIIMLGKSNKLINID